MTTDLTGLWATNRRWRAWMDEHTSFKTPETLDCLRYALIESCEALDCWLRLKNPDHARNNGRDHTVESELADTAMLLLTAIPESWMEITKPPAPEWLFDDICLALAEAAYYCSIDEMWEDKARYALFMISVYPGLDLAAELDRCWRRLADKHGADAWANAIGYKFSSDSDRLRFYARLIKDPMELPVPWTMEETAT